MPGPGEYRPDPTAGIVRVEDLPPPKTQSRSRNYRRRRCPRCGHSCYRDKVQTRTLHDLGDLTSGRPCDLKVTYSQHYCTPCGKYFNADMSDLAPPGAQYTHRVIDVAVRLVVESGLPYRAASEALWRDHRVFVPFATIQNWVEAAGEKARPQMDTQHLDWALKGFSGYVAVDELYEGSYCVLSAVDNRCYRRILFEVLDHAPTHEDIEAFLRRLKEALDQRGLKLAGVTTDGSDLYPKPLHEVFPGVPHQVCQFHVLAEIIKAVLSAVAAARRGFAARKPKLGRGRPSSAKARRAAQKRKRLSAKSRDLFRNRYLFVQRHLTPAERKTLRRITRGLPQLRKLRELMELVYALFDRRCRLATALEKLAKLRQRVKRFAKLHQTLKKLWSPTLEKALTFLDDKLLPATSNAVERGNRRHRKMQKSVYRVRSHVRLVGRIALDMFREAFTQGRVQTMKMLHLARSP